MAKTESSFKNMVLVLFSISLIASLSLGAVYNLTKEPIALAQKQKKESAIKQVVPAFERLESKEMAVEGGGDPIILNMVYHSDSLVGIAAETYSDKGFSGRIYLMVGYKPDGSIINTAVLRHTETPGLGDKMDASKSDFPVQFKNKMPSDFILKVKKDGGNVDAITAATISSRAFCDAVQKGYDAVIKEGGSK